MPRLVEMLEDLNSDIVGLRAEKSEHLLARLSNSRLLKPCYQVALTLELAGVES